MSKAIDDVKHRLKVAKAREVRTRELEKRQERLEAELERLKAQQRAAAWDRTGGDTELQ